MTTLFFDKVATATVGATIFFVLFILLCYAMFGMMSYRFKIIVMTSKELIVMKPFRLQHKRFKFDSIKSMKWDLWEIHRMPDFRKLNILTTSGDRLNISDLEFVNYDKLEKWLIENTNVELNIRLETECRSKTSEIQPMGQPGDHRDHVFLFLSFSDWSQGKQCNPGHPNYNSYSYLAIARAADSLSKTDSDLRAKEKVDPEDLRPTASCPVSGFKL